MCLSIIYPSIHYYPNILYRLQKVSRHKGTVKNNLGVLFGNRILTSWKDKIFNLFDSVPYKITKNRLHCVLLSPTLISDTKGLTVG